MAFNRVFKLAFYGGGFFRQRLPSYLCYGVLHCSVNSFCYFAYALWPVLLLPFLVTSDSSSSDICQTCNLSPFYLIFYSFTAYAFSCFVSVLEPSKTSAASFKFDSSRPSAAVACKRFVAGFIFEAFI